MSTSLEQSNNNNNTSNNNSTNQQSNKNSKLSNLSQQNCSIPYSSPSMFLVPNSMPSTDDELNEKILDTIEKLRSQRDTPPNIFGHQNAVPVINFSNESSNGDSEKQTVLQCVVNRKYIAVLFDDHRVCRFPYTIHHDRLVNNKQASEPSTSSASKKYPPVNQAPSASSNSTTSNNNTSTTTSSRTAAHRRLVRRGGNRRGHAVVMSRSQMIPAQYVPEELINQAQVVLQGKSRNVIIRELQRTNLDVNSAVNNLLSRDDEDFDDGDESPDHFIQSDDLMSLLDSGFHNDHSVIIDPDFNEDIFTYQLRVRNGNGNPSPFFAANGNSSSTNPNSNSNSGTSNNASSNQTSESTPATGSTSTRGRFSQDPAGMAFMDRDINRQLQKRWVVQHDFKPLYDLTSQKSSKKKSDQLQISPISFTDQPEYWLGNNDRKLVQIAGLHSELIAINSNGQLCQWRWRDAEPFKAQTSDGVVYYHPRTQSLGLLTEKISLLSASVIRASVVTESNKIATWIDESIAMITSKLENSASNLTFSDVLQSACSGPFKITSLYVSSLMTCVQISSGALFWWGTPPFSHRKKMAEKGQSEKSKSKTKSTSSSSTKESSEIVQGALVCMRNSPIYQIGTIGFTTEGDTPKIGQLMAPAWKLTESYQFKVLTPLHLYSGASGTMSASSSFSTSNSKNLDRSEMPPPPSPASSTSSESSAPPTKRARRSLNSNNQQQTSSSHLEQEKSSTSNSNHSVLPDKIETWNLRDVVFMEDIKNSPVGRVIKVDGNYVAVKFNTMPACEALSCSTVANKNSMNESQQNRFDNSIESYIQDCRLMRKEDLVVVRNFGSCGQSSSSTSKTFENFQRTPKRVPIAEHLQILAMTLTNLGLHVIAKVGGYRFSYLQINIVSGRIEHENKLSIEYGTFFGTGNNPKSSLIRLYSAGENEQNTIVLCRDGNGTLYPLAKDCTNTVIREPISFNLGPVSSIGLGVFPLPPSVNLSTSSSSSQVQKTHGAIVAIALDQQYLIPAILNSDLDAVRNCLHLVKRCPNEFYSMISELCDGNRNIIHIAVSVCFPTNNKSTSGNADPVQVQIPDNYEEDTDRSMLVDNIENSSDATPQQQSFTESAEPQLNPKEGKPIAHSLLWTLLDSTTLSRHLFDLLSARDYQGLTPFMYAISGRAYSAAQQIFVVMQRVAKMIASNNESNYNDSTAQDIYQRAFIQMLYPRGSSPDHSPLYMLCSNDTCSFTWTGDEHINQDIFECRTCGLVGSLCCCTECARVCHRGHDCKLKRTSPTAYCDCWEKCKCKALVSGCEIVRCSLLERLLTSTDLSTRANSRGEHILLFLVQTVSRQIVEQKQYRPARHRSFSSNRPKNDGQNDEPSSIPDHDLEPPKFARQALEKMLGDWQTVKSMILTGYRSSESSNNQRRRSYLWNMNGTATAYSYEEENSYLFCQNGSALLDKFTCSLLKLPLPESMVKITTTIINAMSDPSKMQESRIVARRFVRSLIRVSLAFMFETNPTNYSVAFAPFDTMTYSLYLDRYLNGNVTHTIPSQGPMKKTHVHILAMIRKIRKVFKSMAPIACEELCEAAESLIAPVKMGMARPSSAFLMPPNVTSQNSNSESLGSITDELFSVDTSAYSNQRDFFDPAFNLHDMMDEPTSRQDNLPPSSHMMWNSFDTPPASSSSNVTDRNANAGSSASAANNHDENSSSQMDTNQEMPPTSTSASNVAPSAASTQSMVYDLSHSSNESQAMIPPNNPSQNQPPEISISQPVLNEDGNSNVESADNHTSASDADLVMEMLVSNSEPDDISNVGGRDSESDSESNPDDASYLSNADNASAQRSVVTGATAGSDVGVASLPYDDESLNSNQDDVEDDDDDDHDIEAEDIETSDSDEASDAGETEPDMDTLTNFITERIGVTGNTSSNNISSVGSSSRQNILQHVQWALRSQYQNLSTSGTGNVESASTSTSNRRSTSNSYVVSENVVQISNSMVGLARAFSILVRHIADLMVIVREWPGGDSSEPTLKLTPAESRQLLQTMEDCLRSTWNWLITSMDSTEAQLRFGCALSNRRLTPQASSNISSPSGSNTNQSSTSSMPSVMPVTQNLMTPARLMRIRTFQSRDELDMLPTFNRNNLKRNLVITRNPSSSNTGASNSASSSNNANATQPTSTTETNQAAHRDFLNYALSLMRAHSNEHYDSLPVLDVSSLKHVAYVFDAFVYFIRRGSFNPNSNSDPFQDYQGIGSGRKANELVPLGRTHSFFRRTNSTLYLGCPRPDPFSAPYHEALPLASRPQLLTPTARREQLFGIPRPSDAMEAQEMLEALPTQMNLAKRHQWTYGKGNNNSASNTPTRNQSVITESRNSQPNKLSVIVMAGSAKHQQQSLSNTGTDHGNKSTPGTSTKQNNSTAQQSQKVYYFGNMHQQEVLLGRWRLTLELFGRLFIDDLSLEPNSIINELCSFSVKESKFRREMELLRISNTTSNSTSRDLNFYKMDRDRNTLLIQTFKELNSVFRRASSQASTSSQPCTIMRVKVTFKDEPGEGTGVARSFYTAFSEAVLAHEKLPSELLSPSVNGTVNRQWVNMDNYMRYRSQAGNNNTTSASNSSSRVNNNSISGDSGSASATTSSSPVNDASSSSLRRPKSPARSRSMSTFQRRNILLERIRNFYESRPTSSSHFTPGMLRRIPSLRYDAPPIVPNVPRHSMPPDPRTALIIRVYTRASTLCPKYAPKITGMLMDPDQDMLHILNNEDEMKLLIEYAKEVIEIHESSRGSLPPTRASTSSSSNIGSSDNASSFESSSQMQNQSTLPSLVPFTSQLPEFFEVYSVRNSKQNNFKQNNETSNPPADDEEDNAPLFYQPGTRGFYSPRVGRATEARLNAFRNVGRIIGVCFVQNELCPISFNRHVIKMILQQPVAWHDLAFFDPELYESLRQLVLDAESRNKDELFAECDFRFAIDLPPEEGGREIELIQNGRGLQVNPQNVYDYVRRYAHYRMVDSQEKAVRAIRQGIFDVIPSYSLDGLTPEDFRLLLNGVNEINVQQLQNYVTFYDESSDPDPMPNFRKWFWWVLERMTNEEKQDLIYFWTGSPALPASEEGFQPMPSVTIRPRDDNYFVTANTCISRLYIPIYSSRSILRQKLLMSIKSKSFGFI